MNCVTTTLIRSLLDILSLVGVLAMCCLLAVLLAKLAAYRGNL